MSATQPLRVTPIGAAEIDAAREYFIGLHTRLTDAWKSLDASSEQRRDEWQRPAGDVLSGSGRLSLIENGATFDRAGVAFSDVSGARLPAAASERHTELAGQPFRAMGTSCVVHPVNPYAPTSHANVRLFTARGGEVWWFGGGFDLTPVYPFDEDARTWHEAARAACAARGAARLSRCSRTPATSISTCRTAARRAASAACSPMISMTPRRRSAATSSIVSRSFAASATPIWTRTSSIVRARAATPFGTREQDFQRLRRGRYVEFNLAFDRGTRFGLQSQARTESLLMSMPPRAEWRYDYRPAPGSPEAALADYLKPRDWLS